MRTLTSRLFWGVVLVTAGVVFLLDNLNIVNISSLVFAFLFAILGAAFTLEFVTNRDHWWAIIPGLTLLSLSAIIAVNQVFPAASEISGALILGGIGLAFLLIFLVRPAFWWAVIPAGVMLTLTAIVILSQFIQGEGIGGIFFLGLAFTFGLLSLVPTPQGRMRWPLIPAGILLIIGIFIVTVSTDLFKYVWPVILILAGLYLFLRKPIIRT
jgi:hypothetical protein